MEGVPPDQSHGLSHARHPWNQCKHQIVSQLSQAENTVKGRKDKTAKTPRWGKRLATKMQAMHKKKKLQKKRKFVGLEWHAALIRQMPVCVRVLKNLVNLVHLCGQLSGICLFVVKNPSELNFGN